MFRKSLSIALGVSAGAFLSASLMLAQTGYKTQSPENQTDTSRSRSGAGKVSASDASFLKKAAAGGAEEVELGKLASDKASDPQIKKFGQRMVEDHSKANEDLKKLAEKKGLDVPAEPDAAGKRDRNRLSKLSGSQFDRAYMRMMVSDHKKDVAEFETISKSAKDPDVRSFAADKLPTLKEHLDLAKTDNARVAPHRTKSKAPKV